jgi:alpha-methylacyl-CoA racemase
LVGALTYGIRAAGSWRDERESNLLDGGEPSYGVYRCRDGKFLAIGAIEPQFRDALFKGLALLPSASRDEIAAVVASRGRDEWFGHFAGTDACVAPVLDLGEAPVHPHNIARRTFLDLDGVFQPGPTPRYSQTRTDRPDPPRQPGADADDILERLGYAPGDIARLRADGALL